jgi:hypothetical protein
MIELTDHEKKICRWVGEQRYQCATQSQRNPGAGPSSRANGPELHIRGAECEFAAAILFNRYWRPSIGRIHDRDIGGKIDVRSNRRLNGDLIIKPADPDEVPFALIITDGQKFWCPGWEFARVVKAAFPLQTYPGCDPAHFAPQSFLRPVHWLDRDVP